MNWSVEKLAINAWNNDLDKLNLNYPSKLEFRDIIVDVEEKIKASPNSVSGALADKVNPVKHSYGDNLYIREIFMPKGELIVSKIHNKRHPYFLMKGDVTVFGEEGAIRIQAPYHAMTEVGTKRILFIHEDSVWITVHGTKKKNLNKIEDEIIAKTYNDVRR